MGLKDKKLFLLDMDGTLYLDDKLFDGAKEFLSRIKANGANYVFLTNNSSKGVESYIDKMSELGIYSDRDEYLTSTECLIYELKERQRMGDLDGNLRIYVMGTTSFIHEMGMAGFNLTFRNQYGMLFNELKGKSLEKDESFINPDNFDMVVLGFDRELTYRKLEDVSKILCLDKYGKIEYLATNPDWVCPASFGSVPDCGSMAFILEKATKKMPRFIGKPNPDMALRAMKKFGCRQDETVLVGDRLYTDIKSGNNAGVDTVFVLSGEGTLDDLKPSEAEPNPANPTYICDSIKDILEEIK